MFQLRAMDYIEHLKILSESQLPDIFEIRAEVRLHYFTISLSQRQRIFSFPFQHFVGDDSYLC